MLLWWDPWLRNLSKALPLHLTEVQCSSTYPNSEILVVISGETGHGVIKLKIMQNRSHFTWFRQN
jgi:hypothetical protein